MDEGSSRLSNRLRAPAPSRSADAVSVFLRVKKRTVSTVRRNNPQLRFLCSTLAAYIGRLRPWPFTSFRLFMNSKLTPMEIDEMKIIRLV